MSRVGKNPVTIPQGVEVKLEGETLSAKGKLGMLSMAVMADLVDVDVADGSVSVTPRGKTKRHRSAWGTTRALAQNLVTGVSEGFEKKLAITGVGYRAQVQGKDLNLQLGFSHDVKFPIPEGITITCDTQTDITIKGADKQRVGEVAANIRSYRGPEPYKGKGVRYANEQILRKEGKKK